MRTPPPSLSSKTGCLNLAPGARFHLSRAPLWGRYTEFQLQAQAAKMAEMEEGPNYKEWSQERLIQRVMELEKGLKRNTSSYAEKVAKTKANSRAERQFDPSKHSTRLIALKFAYLGKRYNGFEYNANNLTPLTTIEEELWKALNKSRLIMPKDTNPLQPGVVNWEGCDYSKCGRTDKGVSAFGQVIGIRVRSNRPLQNSKASSLVNKNGSLLPTDSKNIGAPEDGTELISPALQPFEKFTGEIDTRNIEEKGEEHALPYDHIKDEIAYPVILNRLLPPDIRILAWCPEPPPDFSARHSCKERQYKYFFTQPAFAPIPPHLQSKGNEAPGTAMQDGWLDIPVMKEAAKNFVGLHDFRNFCKVDASKQITNFERRIFHADIVEEDRAAALDFVNGTSFMPERCQVTNGSVQSSQYPKVYSFTLHGSAFLWHQVRHMVAIVFLVGQGLESPSIVSKLLDIEKTPCRPVYEMASDVPLVLWNCVFPQDGDMERKDALQWHYVGDEPGRGDIKYGSLGLMEEVWKLWRERKVDEVLAGKLVDVVASQGIDVRSLTTTPRKGARSQRLFDGRNGPKLQGTYVPVMKKPRLDPTGTINERYAIRKGLDSVQEMKDQRLRNLKRSMSIEDEAVE